MRRAARVLVLLFLAAAAYGAYRWLNPSDETRLRSLMTDVADAVSWTREEGALQKIAAATRLSEMCTPDVSIHVDGPGLVEQRLSGRQEIRDAALGLRAQVKSMQVQFSELRIRIEPSREQASIHLVVSAVVDGSNEPNVQEFRLGLRKTEGDWLIATVEPIRGFGM